jgi:hypothetical protein
LQCDSALSITGLDDHMLESLTQRRDDLCALISKYSKDGDGSSTFKKLLILRHVNLAHRQAAPTKAEHADATDEEIEAFYQDNLEIVVLTGKK